LQKVWAEGFRQQIGKRKHMPHASQIAGMDFCAG
jgi:hypothetical protein